MSANINLGGDGKVDINNIDPVVIQHFTININQLRGQKGVAFTLKKNDQIQNYINVEIQHQIEEHEEKLLEELENIQRVEQENEKQQNKPPLPGKNGQMNKSKGFLTSQKVKPIKIQSSDQFLKDLDASSFIDKK